jgi:integrase
MKLTKTIVDRLTPPVVVPPATSVQAFYRDDTLKGFALRVTTRGRKTFIVEKRIHGKVRRLTLGSYPALTVEQARKEAQKILGKIAAGIDPVAEERSGKASAMSLQAVFDDYLKARKSLKSRTIADYEYIMRKDFSDWRYKPLAAITKDMVAKRHIKLGERSQARANNAMRVLRALFHFAGAEYENAQGRSLFPENPVKRLSHTRGWYRIARRQTVIKTHNLPAWYQSVMALRGDRITSKAEVLRDYLLLILFTGLRREEAASLTWEQVDLEAQTLTVTDTKNHQEHTLPLSDFLYQLLSRRRVQAVSRYVFFGDGASGHIVEPRKQMAKVTAASSVAFTLHDLRRTFITIAEGLDIPAYALKRLLNHKMTNDVTAGYIVSDVERLRVPMQKITDYLLTAAGARCKGDVTPIQQAVG